MKFSRFSPVLTVFLSPALAIASMVTSVEYHRAYSASCNQESSHSGEFTSASYLSCGADTASASGSFDGTFFQLSVAGTYTSPELGGVDATASFDYPMMVRNTEESGFMVLSLGFDNSRFPPNSTPSRLQLTWASVDGNYPGCQGFCDPIYLEFPRYQNIYVPYTEGAPFSFSARMSGEAGNATGSQTGRFQADLSLEIIGFASQMPVGDESWRVYQIKGASVVVLPEPPASGLAVAGLAVVLLASAIRRARIPSSRRG